MSHSSEHTTPMAPQLREVADAAHALQRAKATDEDMVDAARQRCLAAARAALEAGQSLGAMAGAESQGRRLARDQMRSELLRKAGIAHGTGSK
jgi:hypothetical protein